MTKPGRAALEAIIKGCGIELTQRQYDQLWMYHRILREANEELNLTRIHNFENMVLKHYVDSLLVLNYGELPSPLIDMGSGPGLPGIPLKIARPNVHMILAEPRGARAEFLTATCKTLGLEGVEVYANKIGPRFTQKAAGVITRAVASIPETLERVAGCIELGGKMLFMKGPDCYAEVVEAERVHSAQFRRLANHSYEIPGTTHDRRLVVYERIGESTEGAKIRPFEGTIREIISDANPTFKLCRDLLGGRGIRKHGKALVAGVRPVAEVLASFPEYAEAWLTDAEGTAPPAPGLAWVRMTGPLFAELDTAGTRAPMLMVRVPAMPEWTDKAPWPPGCTLFVAFQDPENVGAVIRSAAAFGAARVVLLREAAHPFHPKAVRAAGPAIFQVPLMTGPSIHDLSASGAPILALATDGPDLESEPFPESFGLVPGVEGPGLPDHLREGPRRRIAIAPGVESLNAATATAVALYAWRRGMPQ